MLDKNMLDKNRGQVCQRVTLARTVNAKRTDIFLPLYLPATKKQGFIDRAPIGPAYSIA